MALGIEMKGLLLNETSRTSMVSKEQCKQSQEAIIHAKKFLNLFHSNLRGLLPLIQYVYIFYISSYNNATRISYIKRLRHKG